MNLLELLAEIKRRGIKVASTTDGKLIYAGNLSALTASLMACMKRHKPALIDITIQRHMVLQETGQGRYTRAPLPFIDDSGIFIPDIY